MPAGMILRSRQRASSISDHHRALTIDRYEQAAGKAVHAPNLLLEEFLTYGLWFQRQTVPDLDPRAVEHVRRTGDGFRVVLAGGEEVHARNVVVAAGLAPFGTRPLPFSGLDGSLVSHAADHSDLSLFAGRSVIVVGAGQSALESAALLSEAGARSKCWREPLRSCGCTRTRAGVPSPKSSWPAGSGCPHLRPASAAG